jgi:hypothetical protein
MAFEKPSFLRGVCGSKAGILGVLAGVSGGREFSAVGDKMREYLNTVITVKVG